MSSSEEPRAPGEEDGNNADDDFMPRAKIAKKNTEEVEKANVEDQTDKKKTVHVSRWEKKQDFLHRSTTSKDTGLVSIEDHGMKDLMRREIDRFRTRELGVKTYDEPKPPGDEEEDETMEKPPPVELSEEEREKSEIMDQIAQKRSELTSDELIALNYFNAMNSANPGAPSTSGISLPRPVPASFRPKSSRDMPSRKAGYAADEGSIFVLGKKPRPAKYSKQRFYHTFNQETDDGDYKTRSRSPRSRSRSRSKSSSSSSRSSSGSRSPDPYRIRTSRELSPFSKAHENWKRFKLSEEALLDKMQLRRKIFDKRPESHPKYQKEWKAFWEKRYDELLAENKDAENYDYKSEWVPFWNERLVEIFDEEQRVKLKDLQNQFRLETTEEPKRPVELVDLEEESEEKNEDGDKKAEEDSDDDLVILEFKESAQTAYNKARKKWANYKKSEDVFVGQISRKKDIFGKRPELYPKYEEEFSAFKKKKMEELAEENKDTKDYDFKSEWILIWPERLAQIFDGELKEKTKALLAKFEMTTADEPQLSDFEKKQDKNGSEGQDQNENNGDRANNESTSVQENANFNDKEENTEEPQLSDLEKREDKSGSDFQDHKGNSDQKGSNESTSVPQEEDKSGSDCQDHNLIPSDQNDTKESKSGEENSQLCGNAENEHPKSSD